MNTPMELEAERNAALQKIGRNVVNLQKVEAMLKFLLLVSDQTVPASMFSAEHVKRAKRIARMPMGELVERTAKGVFFREEVKSKIPVDIQEPWLSLSFAIESDDATRLAWRKNLRRVVQERNALIHKLLAKFDPHSIESCKSLSAALDEQRARLSDAYSSVESMFKAAREGLADIAAGNCEITPWPGSGERGRGRAEPQSPQLRHSAQPVDAHGVLYHIVAAADWRPGLSYRPLNFPACGFIHCATFDQVPHVANRFFAGRRDLLILTIDPKRLDVPVKYENLEGGSELFPHIYGVLDTAAVVDVQPFSPGVDGVFSFPTPD
jgi:uncharacterized protein (DUF952 family)